MKKPWWALPLLLVAMQAPAADKAPVKPKKQRMVCTDAPATGSHIRRRSCVTEEQADERLRRDQDKMARMKPSVRPSSGTGQ